MSQSSVKMLLTGSGEILVRPIRGNTPHPGSLPLMSLSLFVVPPCISGWVSCSPLLVMSRWISLVVWLTQLKLQYKITCFSLFVFFLLHSQKRDWQQQQKKRRWQCRASQIAHMTNVTDRGGKSVKNALVKLSYLQVSAFLRKRLFYSSQKSGCPVTSMWTW